MLRPIQVAIVGGVEWVSSLASFVEGRFDGPEDANGTSLE